MENQNSPEGANKGVEIDGELVSNETIEVGFLMALNDMYSYYLGQTKEATDDDRYNLITELIAKIQDVQSIIEKL